MVCLLLFTLTCWLCYWADEEESSQQHKHIMCVEIGGDCVCLCEVKQNVNGMFMWALQ